MESDKCILCDGQRTFSNLFCQECITDIIELGKTSKTFTAETYIKQYELDFTNGESK